MEILRSLASIRCGFLDALMSGITYLGSEVAFMAAALLIFWCVNKRQGYYVFLVGAFGTICNQFLKLAFRIPRPWVLDPQPVPPAIPSPRATRRILSARQPPSLPAARSAPCVSSASC